MRTRHRIRYSPNAGRSVFASQSEKNDALARLDELITVGRERNASRRIQKIARQRRRKVSGWVVGV